jgi:ABC-type transport system involved in multi-copper enzyme maturation permease subunit
MRQFLILWRRELHLSFLRPVGYCQAAVFLFLSGTLLAWKLMAGAFDLSSVPALLFSSVFFWLVVLATCAMLTMRLVAEERTAGTWDLLMTAPIHEAEIVAAKFAGALTLFVAMSLPILATPFFLRACGLTAGEIDLGSLAGAALILFWVGAFFIAVGTLLSCLTRSQAIAGIGALTVNGVLFFWGAFPIRSSIFSEAGPALVMDPAHYVQAFASGFIDSRPLIVLALGGLLVLFFAVQTIQWQRFRIFSETLNLGMALMLALGLMSLGVILAHRHYRLADWTRSHRYSLSEKTLQILRNLNERVDVTFVCRPHHTIYGDLRRLLMQYGDHGATLRLEWVDPDRDPGRVEELLAQDAAVRSEAVVFKSPTQVRTVVLDDLLQSVSEEGGLFHPRAPTGLAAEEAFTAALLAVTEPVKPAVYFLMGHGEAALDDYHPERGFSTLARLLRSDHLELKPLLLGESAQIPTDAAALVIGGPTHRLTHNAITAIAEYLNRSGRLLLLADSGMVTGLESLLEDWGVRLNHDRVISKPLLAGAGDALVGTRGVGLTRELELTHFGDHPITAPLQGMLITLYQPRTLTLLGGVGTDTEEAVDKPRITVLANAGEDSWAETDFQQTPANFDSETDRRGPAPVAVAIERGPAGRVAMGLQPTRLAVIGDSHFAANGRVGGGNQDLVRSAVHWLLQRDFILGPSPRLGGSLPLVLEGRQRTLVLVMLVMGFPGCVLLWGLLVGWVRRRV